MENDVLSVFDEMYDNVYDEKEERENVLKTAAESEKALDTVCDLLNFFCENRNGMTAVYCEDAVKRLGEIKRALRMLADDYRQATN